MDLEQKRQALSAQPLTGWWDRTELVISSALNDSRCTCCTHMVGDHWVPERKAVHDQLIDKYVTLYADIPRERKSVTTGGGPGVGKTRLLHNRSIPETYAVVDADLFKAELVNLGLVEDLPGLTPLESSCLTHVETTQIAKSLFRRLVKDGTNIAWDFTMSAPGAIHTRLGWLNRAQYTNHALFVEVDSATARKRVLDRHQQGVESFLAGEGLGGRFVPFGHIDYNGPSYVFQNLKGAFTTWERVDNNSESEKVIDAKS